MALAAATKPADDVELADGVVAADSVVADVFVPDEAAWACKVMQSVALAMAISVFMEDARFEVSLILLLVTEFRVHLNVMISWPSGLRHRSARYPAHLRRH